MIGRIKQLCLSAARGVYRRALKPALRPLMFRLREYLNAEGPDYFRLYEPALNDDDLRTQVREQMELTRQTDRMMLAFMKSAPIEPATTGSDTYPAAAVPVGNGRLLVRHPDARFMYLDSNDLVATPRILFDTYQPAVRIALSRLVGHARTIVQYGAGCGYHTLTIAHIMHHDARLYVCEHDPTPAAILRDNITAHQIDNSVCVCPPGHASHATPEPYPEQRVIAAADLVYIADTTHADVLVDAHLAARNDATTFVMWIGRQDDAAGREGLSRMMTILAGRNVQSELIRDDGTSTGPDLDRMHVSSLPPGSCLAVTVGGV